MAGPKARGERREPGFGTGLPVDLAADPRERAAPPRRGAKAKTPKGRGARVSPRAARRTRSLAGRLVGWTLGAMVWGLVALAALVAWQATKIPSLDRLAVPKRPPNIAVLALDGSLLANRGETGGREVSIKELPPYLPRAFVAIEDRRFYSHLGIDPVGLARAVAANATGRGGMQGGSTLTQQLAKNLFLTQERTLSRKVQEAILAFWLERHYTKDQILELYLNRVYFGAGSYGVEAAARRYFGKSARQVSVAEAAMLGGVVQAPSRLAPTRDAAAAQRRAAMVVSAMQREGFIDAPAAKLALASPATPARAAGAGSAGYVADFVADQLDALVGEIEGDVSVSTTIDPRIQSAAERTLVEALARGEKQGAGQGALVALAPDGAVRAIVGGRDYAAGPFNRATSAKRQPGSAFKPFVYLAAFEAGLTPDTVREDGPVNIKGWKPENYTHQYFGPVPLHQALAMSLNTVAVKLAVEVGPRRVVEVAQRMGIDSPLKPNPSLALGTSEVTPLDLAGAYAPLANGGIGVEPHVVTRVKGADGRVLFQRRPGNRGRVVAPAVVAMMNETLRETLLSGTGKKAEVPGQEAAGKTGTTQDYGDAWFVGYTSNLVAAVWFGNDDNTPMKKVTGGGLPAETWARFMRAATNGTPASPLPGLAGKPWREEAPAAPAEARELVQAEGRPFSPPPARERGLLERLFGGD